MRDHRIEQSVLAPFGGASHGGWLFLVTDDDLGDDLLPLAAIAALRIGAEIEHHYLRVELVEAAVREGRSRLARDIHDSLLQSLAATGLQLRILERELPPAERRKVVDIRNSLTEQQDRIRQFISEARGDHRGHAMDMPVEAALAKVLKQMEAQWNCETSLSVKPAGLAVRREAAVGLSLFTTEAVANGVRHGKATSIRLDVVASEGDLSVRLRDNGRGLPGPSGILPHETVFGERLGSASLRRRAADLGAVMNLRNSQDGLEINLKVPLR